MAVPPASMPSSVATSVQKDPDQTCQLPVPALGASLVAPLAQDPSANSKPLDSVQDLETTTTDRQALQELSANLRAGMNICDLPKGLTSAPYWPKAPVFGQALHQTEVVSLTSGDLTGLSHEKSGPTLQMKSVLPAKDYEQSPDDPSPLGLNIGQLSLEIPASSMADPKSQLFGSEPQPSSPKKPQDVNDPSIVTTESFAHLFKSLDPTDVIVIYDKGKVITRIDKEHICGHSKFFARAFDGDFLTTNNSAQEAHTRVVRLRCDFPYAVRAMMEFFGCGFYSLLPKMREEYPLITMLDLHVHAYVVADKYDVPKLSNYAIDQYIKSAADIFSLPFDKGVSGVKGAKGRSLVKPRHPGDQSPAAEIDRLLDSMVLLWKNTGGGHDIMRKAVMELVKPVLSRLAKLKMFRTMLTDLEDFLDDLNQSLVGDGMKVRLGKDISSARYVMVFGGKK